MRIFLIFLVLLAAVWAPAQAFTGRFRYNDGQVGTAIVRAYGSVFTARLSDGSVVQATFIDGRAAWGQLLPCLRAKSVCVRVGVFTGDWGFVLGNGRTLVIGR